MQPKSKKIDRPKYQFLQDRASEAAIQGAKRRKMQPWNGRDEPDFEVETPWNGKE